jgi:hypothetical protein
VAFVLVIAVLIKDGVLTKNRIVDNKELFDAISKIATILVLFIGGILSYVRFFKGRTLGPKLILKLQSGVVSVDKGLLHWIEIEIQNTGSVSIWNYDVKIYATYHGTFASSDEITEFVYVPHDLEVQEHVVDVGESAFEHAFLVVLPHVNAVTFQVVLIDQNRTMWTRCLTVKNSESSA